MESRTLRDQIAVVRQSFFDEGILDSQFTELERLEDKENPHFAEEVLTFYFKDSATMLATVEQAMETNPIDFSKIDGILHQLKGSSASIGANKVYNEVTKTREFWQEGNLEGTKAAFQEVRKEHDTLKAKLEPYFQQLREAELAAMRPQSQEGSDHPKTGN